MNNYQNKISVIIATYNAEKTIKRAINSVLKQGEICCECIVIDALSKDYTIDVIKSYSSEKLSYISEKDNGIFDALNKGVKMAKGDWIYVLGADDELLDDGLDKFQDSIACGEFDIIYANTIERYGDGYLRYPKSKNYNLVIKNMFTCHQGMIMKRQMMEKLDYFNINYKKEADFDITQRAYLGGYKFKQIYDYVAYFSMTGVTGQFTDFFDWERYHILKNNKSCSFPFFVVLIHAVKMFIKRNLISIKKHI